MRMAMHIQYKISDSLKIHLPKIIKKLWKFDEVWQKQKMHQFFLSHSVYFDYFMLLQAMRSGGYFMISFIHQK